MTAPPIAGVYFIRSGDVIKIGTSTNVADRMRSLATMSPAPLELLAVAEGDYAQERQLHRLFAHLRKHGEWFAAAPELLEYIDRIPLRQPGRSAE